MREIWCNGQWMPSGDFSLSHTDRGLLHGLGLFETLLAVDGRLPLAPLHQDRLLAACSRLGWFPDLPDLACLGANLLRRNDFTRGRARLRFAITAGTGTPADLAQGTDACRILIATPLGAAPPPLAVNLSPWPRNEKSPLAGLKCASYAENLIALAHATRRGFAETLFFNTAGHLAEAAMANVFLVHEGGLLTPSLDSGCLPGIARRVVLGLARRAGISTVEAALTTADLEAASAVFLTSAVRGVVPVERLGERSLAACPVTSHLVSLWDQHLTASFPSQNTF